MADGVCKECSYSTRTTARRNNALSTHTNRQQLVRSMQGRLKMMMRRKIISKADVKDDDGDWNGRTVW